jgi:hypothetical protein
LLRLSWIPPLTTVRTPPGPYSKRVPGLLSAPTSSGERARKQQNLALEDHSRSGSLTSRFSQPWNFTNSPRQNGIPTWAGGGPSGYWSGRRQATGVRAGGDSSSRRSRIEYPGPRRPPCQPGFGTGGGSPERSHPLAQWRGAPGGPESGPRKTPRSRRLSAGTERARIRSRH